METKTAAESAVSKLVPNSARGKFGLAERLGEIIGTTLILRIIVVTSEAVLRAVG